MILDKVRGWVNSHTPDFGLEGDADETIKESKQIREEMRQIRLDIEAKKWLSGEFTGNPLRDPMIRERARGHGWDGSRRVGGMSLHDYRSVPL